MPHKQPSFCPTRPGKHQKCKRPETCSQCRKENVDGMTQ
jgi:hypothetical protein